LPFPSPLVFFWRRRKSIGPVPGGRFQSPLSLIEKEQERLTPEEVFRVFASGAIVGYLNPASYPEAFDDGYADNFQALVREAFAAMTEEDGRLDLLFNRIYLVAQK